MNNLITREQIHTRTGLSMTTIILRIQSKNMHVYRYDTGLGKPKCAISIDDYHILKSMNRRKYGEGKIEAKPQSNDRFSGSSNKGISMANRGHHLYMKIMPYWTLNSHQKRLNDE